MFTAMHTDFASAQSDYRRASSMVEYRADRRASSRPTLVARIRAAFRTPVRPVVAVEA